MQFTHDFKQDLADIDLFSKEKFALGRFADGELAILQMRPIPTADGWRVHPHETEFRQALATALRADVPGWHVGISCPCCDLAAHRWYMDTCRVPDDRRTYANIWCNANYDEVLRRIRDEQWLTRCAIVTNPEGCKRRPDYLCSENVVDDLWGIDQIVKRLETEGRPILLACGPAGAVIAHKVWTQVENPPTIVDIGSILDPLLKGRPSRGYHDPANPNRGQVCRWTVVNDLL